MFYDRTIDVEGQFEGWLVESWDYGATFEQRNDSLLRPCFHPSFGVLGGVWLGYPGGHYCVSLDSGATYELVNWDTRAFRWLPGSDSLIAASQYFEYSYDTLRTWQEVEIRHEPRGNLMGTDKRMITGWDSGDMMILTNVSRQGGGIDTFIVSFTTTYCDSFFEIAAHPVEVINPYDRLIRGYAPGESYLYDSCRIKCSVDTGRTWQSMGPPPFQPHWLAPWDMTCGWNPGELLFQTYYTDPWTMEHQNEVWHSLDYGATWDLIWDLEVEDYADHGNVLPASDDLQVWPNPTNSHVTIQLGTPVNGALTLFSIDGRLLREVPIVRTRDRYELNLIHQASGTYLLRVNGADKPLHRRITVVK